jgi:hypothetical protein
VSTGENERGKAGIGMVELVTRMRDVSWKLELDEDKSKDLDRRRCGHREIMLSQ